MHTVLAIKNIFYFSLQYSRKARNIEHITNNCGDGVLLNNYICKFFRLLEIHMNYISTTTTKKQITYSFAHFLLFVKKKEFSKLHEQLTLLLLHIMTMTLFTFISIIYIFLIKKYSTFERAVFFLSINPSRF